MVSKAFVIAAVIAYVEARFGQEQVPIAAISAVQGGDAGAAATIAGAAISDLLGGANSCAKLTRADQVFTELGGGADALAAAIGLVTAEKNTNPFANGNVQNVCGDPSLPVTPELRGITPLIDPAVDVDGAVAALSASSAGSPLAADGLSVFDLLDQAGFGNLVVSQAAAGGAAAGNAQQANNNNQQANNNNQQANNNNQQANNNNKDDKAAADANADANADDNADDAADDVADDAAAACEAAAVDNKQQDAAAADKKQKDAAAKQKDAAANNNKDAAADNKDAAAGNQQDAAAGNQQDAAAGNQQDAAAGNDNQAAAGAGALDLSAADFGLCQPTITFQGGEGNRPATEFTFQIADPLARGGQGEALNPNIITNALCNQLTNVCEANAAAVSACEEAQAQVAAAGTRDKSTADLFNSLLGNAGFVTNPLGGPANPPARKAARSMRRGLRL